MRIIFARRLAAIKLELCSALAVYSGMPVFCFALKMLAAGDVIIIKAAAATASE